MNESDQHWLSKAFKLTEKSIISGGGPFGAVIVRDGKIIGQGHNRVPINNDPTAHAEIEAIRDAARNVNHFHLEEATLYVNCEPCPMCMAAAYWARISRIVYAATAEDAAAVGFNDAHIRNELSNHPDNRQIPLTQLERESAVELLQKWFQNHQRVQY